MLDAILSVFSCINNEVTGIQCLFFNAYLFKFVNVDNVNQVNII